MTGPDQQYKNSHKVNTQTLGARTCTKKSRFKTSRLQKKGRNTDVDQFEAERENKQPRLAPLKNQLPWRPSKK